MMESGKSRIESGNHPIEAPGVAGYILTPAGVSSPLGYINGEITAPGTMPYDEAIAQAGDDMFRQAVCDDARWEVDVTVPTYQEVGVDDIVNAPRPAELAAWNALNVADDETRITYLVGELPNINQRLVERYNPVNTPRYDLCTVEYWSASRQAHDAVVNLNRVMAGHEMSSEAYGAMLRQRFTGQYALDDGTLVPATTTVSMRITPQAELIDAYGNAAITAHTYAEPKDIRIQGGVAAANGSELPPDRKIRADEITPPPLRDITDSLATSIRHDAWADGVRPWVESYMALPQPTTDVPLADEKFGKVYVSSGVRALLTGGETNAEDALTTLRFAFGGQGIGWRLEKLSELHLPDLVVSLSQYGVTDRFDWLVRNAEAIHSNVVEAERRALDSQFRGRFTAWREQIEAAIQRVAALSDEMERLGGQQIETITARHQALVVHYPPRAWVSPESSANDRSWLERFRQRRSDR